MEPSMGSGKSRFLYLSFLKHGYMCVLHLCSTCHQDIYRNTVQTDPCSPSRGYPTGEGAMEMEELLIVHSLTKRGLTQMLNITNVNWHSTLF